MSGIQPPRFANTGACLLSDDETRRLRAFVSRCLTDREACRRLGVSAGTLVELCHRGRVLARTRDRVLARLEELERGEVAA
jgi:hypothetical protein